MELGTAGNEAVPFSLEDKLTHLHISGKTGQGKSVLLENMMFDDLAEGRGFAFLDPHGQSAERIADCVPKNRINDLIYLDPSHPDCPGFNPLHTDDIALSAEHIVTTMRNIWPDSWGPRLEYILHSALRLLLYTDGTLLDVKKVLVNRAYRQQLLDKLGDRDPDLRAIWEDEFAPKPDKQWQEEISSTINKVGRITPIPALRNVLGRNSIDFSKIMDGGKILICNLNLKKLGRSPASLIGALIVSGFAQAAEARTGTPRPFYLYVDECRNFLTETFETTVSESRKWKLGLVLASQYITQLPESLRDAILGNVGTLISFQVGANTARILADEFDKPFKLLTDLPKYNALIKLPGHDPRIMKTSPPRQMKCGYLTSVKNNTRARYAGKARKPQPHPPRRSWG